MSTDLATLQSDTLATRHDDSVFQSLSIQGSFDPRVQLYTGKSKLVERGKFPANHWGIVTGKDKIDDLGEHMNAVPLAYRPMALDLSGDKAVSHYDPKSEGFGKSVVESSKKDSKHMAGIQFLLYVQGRGFATLFCASKSAKALAPKIRKLIYKFVSFGSETIDTGQWVFRAPTISETNVQFDLPENDALRAKINEFTGVTGSVQTEKDAEDAEFVAAPAQNGTERPR
jgi:hypothetical protein